MPVANLYAFAPKVETNQRWITMGQNKKKRRFTRPRLDEMEEFKRFLGPEIAGQHTDAELSALYRDMHLAANLLLELWFQKRGGTSDDVAELGE